MLVKRNETVNKTVYFLLNLYINIFILDLSVDKWNILVYHKKSYIHIMLEIWFVFYR